MECVIKILFAKMVIATRVRLNPNYTLITSSDGRPVTEKVNKLPTSLLPENEQQEKGGHNLCWSFYSIQQRLREWSARRKDEFSPAETKRLFLEANSWTIWAIRRFPVDVEKLCFFYPASFFRDRCSLEKKRVSRGGFVWNDELWNNNNGHFGGSNLHEAGFLAFL